MIRLLSRVLEEAVRPCAGHTTRTFGRTQRRLLCQLLQLAIVCWPISAALSATRYLYDDLGRLVLVAEDGGSATVYQHDANGNIVEVTNWGASSPAIATFSPSYGHVGTIITILGTGFSPTPSQNAVTVGGVTTTVNASTATSITTTIPSGAVTGPIGVTVGGVTATSSNSIVVLYPAITSFSPEIVAPGGSVTVTGANLNLVPGGTTFKVGDAFVSVTSLSNTQAVLTAPSGGVGHVTVETPYGDATSATNLTVVPATIGVANVVDYAGVSAGGSPVGLTIEAQNKYAILNFDAIEGQYLSIQIDSLVATPTYAQPSYTLYSSAGAALASGSVGSTYKMSAHLPKIPATGAYFVAFASGTGSSISLTAALEVNQALSQTGASTSSATTAARQSKRFTFEAAAGDDIGIATSDLTITPNSPAYARVSIYRPDGQYISSFWGYLSGNPGSGASYRDLPQTGTYTVLIEPQGASTLSFDLTVSDDVADGLTAGTPTAVDLARIGQIGLLTFDATAGETIALYLSSISTVPSGKNVAITAYRPSGAALGSTVGSSQKTLNFSNLPETGTYFVLLQPADAATASMQLTLANGVTGSLPSDGTSQSFSTTVPRQNAYFTFSATAGDDLGIALTGLALQPSSPSYVRFWIYRPDGYSISSSWCYATTVPGCSESLLNLPLTGTYTVMIEPQGDSTITGALTLSSDLTGTLIPGTPMSVTLSAPGRMGLPTFSATAGDTIALHLSSISTTPAGKNVTMTVYKPSGGGLSSAVGSSQKTLNLSNLPETGVYSVLLRPADGATATMQLTLANGVTGSLPSDGTSQSFSTTVPRQNAYLTFSATAGDDMGIALTGLALQPSSPNYVKVSIYRPDGYSLSGNWCYTTTTPGCSQSLLNLPLTGTYTVMIEPQGDSTMSFTLTLSQNVTGTLTSTPLPLALSVPGQQGWPSFTATAGQNLAVTMSSIATTPAGKSVTMRVYNPSGGQIASTISTTGATLNLTNLAAGTYNVLLLPADAATATLDVQVQ